DGIRDDLVTGVQTCALPIFGTAAHGSVLYTSSAAALRGFNVIVPVDGMSTVGEHIYVEQYVAYNLTHAPVLSPKVTLTRTDMIKIGRASCRERGASVEEAEA